MVQKRNKCCGPCLSQNSCGLARCKVSTTSNHSRGCDLETLKLLIFIAHHTILKWADGSETEQTRQHYPLNIQPTLMYWKSSNWATHACACTSPHITPNLMYWKTHILLTMHILTCTSHRPMYWKSSSPPNKKKKNQNSCLLKTGKKR